MKYVIETICNSILHNLAGASGETMVKVDCFNDLSLYEAVARTIDEAVKKRGQSVNIKLAQRVADRHKTNCDTTIWNSLVVNGWLSDKQSLTYYRNLHNTDLLLLLGTEEEDDKGGLSNFFTITPSTLLADLNGSYSKVFSNANSSLDEETLRIIDALYNDLFQLVAPDILKLSQIADTYASNIGNAAEFIQLFYKILPMWGIPTRALDLPKQKAIYGKANILRPAFNFISRVDYVSMTPAKFKKILSQFDEYDKPDSGQPYKSDWEGWSETNIGSFQALKEIVLDFAQGKDIEQNRAKLLQFDFAIIEDILGLRIAGGKATKKTTLKLYGDPLNAFVTALLEALITIKSNDYADTITSLKVELSHAEVVSSFGSNGGLEAGEYLTKMWARICRHTNGVVEFINQWNWGLTDTIIDYSYVEGSEDFFDPKKAEGKVQEGTIRAAKPNSANKIHFKIHAFAEETEITKLMQDCLWQFTEDSPWLHSFADITERGEGGHIFLPLATTNKVKQMLFAKSDEEFFDILDESIINFDFDISTFATNKKNPSSFVSEFTKLGQAFGAFISDLSDNGFYWCLQHAAESNLNQLISVYTELGQSILKQTFPDNQKWVFDAFIHAFNIEESPDVITSGADASICVVPPWHPATLQRIKDQKVFILDGCREWVHDSNDGLGELTKSHRDRAMYELMQMSLLQGSLDIFPSHSMTYFGLINTYGAFSIYGRTDIENEGRLKDMIHKDAIFDDDFSNSEVTKMNDDAQMIYGVLEDYLKAFPASFSDLSLIFINPSDLQPIVAAIRYFVQEMHGKKPDALVNITLKILVKPENKGGRNYLAYWMDEFFSEDENASVKTYLNEWRTSDDLERLLNGNHDIAFAMELLKLNSLQFLKTPDIDIAALPAHECMFPVVYKPSPISSSSVSRKIEISQPQFRASFAHTQVVRYKNNSEDVPSSTYLAVKETKVDSEGEKLVATLHEKAYWVVCIDSGLDGALLRKMGDSQAPYSIIGFSTGKGSYGQYNVTITARHSILNVVTKKFKNRLAQLFHWPQSKIDQSAQLCIKEASGLDGISLFSAINQEDQNIREFMAYVLTSLWEKKQGVASPLKIIVHLDSYKHWFSSELDPDEEGSKSRPDFLMLEVLESPNEQLSIKATVIECKTANYANAFEHKEKALEQVQHGIKRLSKIFNPASTSIKKRYWFSQLYRALVFSQVTFSDNSDSFGDLARKLRSILDGKFEIDWSGKVLGYWLDFVENDVIVENTSVETIKIFNIPQVVIQNLLSGTDDSAFVTVDDPFAEDDDLEEFIENIDDEEESDEPEDQTVSVTFTPPASPAVPQKEETSEEKEPAQEKPAVPEPPVSIEPPVSPKPPIAPANISLDSVRVLVGSSKTGEEIFWEFGNKNLANRHMLITGTSGQGKTYSIQTMLYELSKAGISSMVFDYTEGFRVDQLEPEFVHRMDGKLSQRIVYAAGVPINPFKKQTIDIAGTTMPEKPADVAGRIANILTHVYGFGEQQYAAVFEAAQTGLIKYGDKMNMARFAEELAQNKSSYAKTASAKMMPFFSTIEFVEDPNFDWDKVLYPSESRMTIFQLTSISREIQVIITELMLWDAWYYTKKVGSKDKPFAVVLDEAQNLSHKQNSPSAAILTEGRKFGWSAWFATQSLEVLADDEVVRLMQSAFKLYFKPTDKEISKMAKQIDPSNASLYVSSLTSLKKGHCFVLGDRLRPDGTLGQGKPTITSVTSFDKRP